jgi:hypothetical protein
MKFDTDSQIRFAQSLGILPEGDTSNPEIWKAISDDRHGIGQVNQVFRLLERMRVEREKMASAAKWIEDAIASARREFDGWDGAPKDGIHSVSLGMYQLGGQALEYEQARAAYAALQDHLSGLVIGIRRARGEEVGAFDRF